MCGDRREGSHWVSDLPEATTRRRHSYNDYTVAGRCATTVRNLH